MKKKDTITDKDKKKNIQMPIIPEFDKVTVAKNYIERRYIQFKLPLNYLKFEYKIMINKCYMILIFLFKIL